MVTEYDHGTPWNMDDNGECVCHACKKQRKESQCEAEDYPCFDDYYFREIQ